MSRALIGLSYRARDADAWHVRMSDEAATACGLPRADEWAVVWVATHWSLDLVPCPMCQAELARRALGWLDGIYR
jgi:hypothetical protein